ncbi:unnamed protein product [Clonostachys solani]|uniref:Uncharacterized protein n=1 Tax=Clonostachys solani TaxID=160281 RepID=A0A9N9ZAK2_9HYPO|nr:unnamed protein product [Clonostachys solani]
MVALKQLSVTAVLWLGLASRGLAQSLDKPDDLAVRGENVEEIVARDVDLGLEERDEDDELETRDIEDELVEIRDFEDDLLEARDIEEELLEARDLYVRQRQPRPRPAPLPAPRPRPGPFLLPPLLLPPTVEVEDDVMLTILRLGIFMLASASLVLVLLLFLLLALALDRFLPLLPPHLQGAATEGSETRMTARTGCGCEFTEANQKPQPLGSVTGLTCSAGKKSMGMDFVRLS